MTRRPIRGRAGLSVAALLILGTAVRALRFWGPFPLWAHWDETRLAAPAIGILDGELPVHHLGVEYMGATPAYPLAVWFALVGRSTFTLDLFAYAAGIAMFLSGWLLARRLLLPPAARFALAGLVAPPLLLASWSLNGNLNYPVLLVLGNLFLAGTHGLIRAPRRRASLVGLGLLAGLGWWTNPLFVVYLAPLALVGPGVGLARPSRLAPLAAGVLLGCLPILLYELRFFPSARFMVAESGDAGGSVPHRAWLFFARAWPTVVGRENDVLSPVLRALSLGAIALSVLAVVLATRARGTRPGARLILWPVALASIALVVVTERGEAIGGTGVRYLLPLYSVFPLWLGVAIWRLWERRPPVGATALALWVTFQLGVNWMATLGSTPPKERRWTALSTKLAPLIDWLDAHGIHHVYWEVPGVGSFEFTFLTGSRIIAAELWREQSLPHARLVDAAIRPAFVIAQDSYRLRESLAGLGLPFQETTIGELSVFRPDGPPTAGVAPLDRAGWVVAASENAEAAADLVDGDVTTGWSTLSGKSPGQWVQVDLGRETSVERLDLLAIDWREVPVGFRVSVSSDGTNWRTVADVPHYWGPLFAAEHHPFLRVRRGRVQARFPATRARYLRLTQTGEDPETPWSARELFVYEPAPLLAQPPPSAIAELRAALWEDGVSWVYANTWLSARIQADSHGTIRSQESNLYPNSYGRPFPDPRNLDPFRAEPGRAVLLAPDADRDGVHAMLAGQHILVGERSAGGYSYALLTGPAPRPARVSKVSWTATASEQSGQAPRAMDGDRASAWESETPPGPSTSITLDLGRPQRIGRLRLVPGLPGVHLEALRLEGSPDGDRWESLGPLTWAGPLYWTGWELLRDGRPGWDVAFPAVTTRVVRFGPATPWPLRRWRLAEIELFE